MKTLVLLALLLGACIPPTQHAEAQYGVVHVAVGLPLDDADPWLPDQVVQITREVSYLNALGPTFVMVDSGAPVVDVTVRPFDAGENCTLGVGRFSPGDDYVEVDAACAHGFDELREATGHEIGHWLGMSHVCQTIGEATDCDGHAGYGVAMMNPDIAYDVHSFLGETDQGDDSNITYSQDVPTRLDLAEYLLTRHR